MNLPDNPYIYSQYLSSRHDLPKLEQDDREFLNRYPGTPINKRIQDGTVISPSAASYVNAYWTKQFLILRFVSFFKELTIFEPPITEGKRVGLWERDVVETFIHPVDGCDVHEYLEFQVAPTGEKMDLKLRLPHRDFLWNSGFETATYVNRDDKIWEADMCIPFAAFKVYEGYKGHVGNPKPYDDWRINFFRNIASENLFLSWVPTMSDTAHVPCVNGRIVFMK